MDAACTAVAPLSPEDARAAQLAEMDEAQRLFATMEDWTLQMFPARIMQIEARYSPFPDDL